MNEETRKFLSENGRKGGKAVSAEAAHKRAVRANKVRWKGKKKRKKKLAILSS